MEAWRRWAGALKRVKMGSPAGDKGCRFRDRVLVSRADVISAAIRMVGVCSDLEFGQKVWGGRLAGAWQKGR